MSPPTASTSWASSVARARSPSESAFSSGAAWKTCGVWTTHSVPRWSVAITRPPASASLIVSTARAAATTPSHRQCSRRSMQRSKSSGVARGRAASWMSSSREPSSPAIALATDSERVSPPVATVKGIPGTVWPAIASISSSCPGGAAITVRCTRCAAPRAVRHQQISGRPASGTSAFGAPAPNRSPLPAAATTAVAIYAGAPDVLLRSAGALRVALLEKVVEVLLGLLLVHVERVHELGREDLLRPREHLLLAGREALLEVPDRQVADDLRKLEHVAGLHLVAVVLEPAVPVLRHLADVVAQHRKHSRDVLLADHSPQACPPRAVARHHHGHVVVKDLDREVLARLAEHLLLLLLQDLARPVMWIDHLVAHLVRDVDDLGDFYDGLRLEWRCLRNGVPPSIGA